MKRKLALEVHPQTRLQLKQVKYVIISSLIAVMAGLAFFVYLNLGQNENAAAETGTGKKQENNLVLANHITAIASLPGVVNSRYREINPIVSADGQSLFFGRKQHPLNKGGIMDYEDIWCAQYDAQRDLWLYPENNFPTMNNEGPNFMCAMHEYEGATYAILGNEYGRKGKMLNGVSYSVKENEEWSTPEPFKIKYFYNLSQQVDYTISKDGRVMILSIAMEDTKGLRDLYVSFREDEDSWSQPMHMGPVINTVGTDATPFLSANNEYLYFASTGHNSMGGSDIFVSKRLDDTWSNWTRPENLGDKINTPMDEEYFHLPAEGDFAYFTRGNEKGDTDILRAEIDQDKTQTDVYAWAR